MAKNKMGLAEFHRYLDEIRRQVEACYAEIEEIQFQFNDIFKRELTEWQEQFGFCFPRLLAQRKEMPEAFARRIDKAEAEERERLRREIAELEELVAQNERRMEELLAQAQQITQSLRKANPELDRREEHLKSLIVQYEDEYARAYERLEQIDTFPLGWLTHWPQIRRLKKVQAQAKKQQAEALNKMRQVRSDWVKQVDEAGEAQAALRQQWQELSVRTAQAKSELDQKVNAFDILAEQAALQRVLEELEEAPAGVKGELGPALEDLARRNKIRRSYEEGLKAVAEALGLLKGIGEGLKRFRLSVGTVLQEQRRYNLRPISVEVPDAVMAINDIWPTLQARVRDEKYMGTHPLEFSRLVKQYLNDRLGEQSIQHYFEEMGEALNRATKAWS
ncbi:MAG: hypothetical protein H5T69_00355 [Chloroflexi bacterium]|nr:hypothetical protein [Chloroflexota bacterium]